MHEGEKVREEVVTSAETIKCRRHDISITPHVSVGENKNTPSPKCRRHDT